MENKAKQLWLRWTLVNAMAEMVGLGLTFAIIGWITIRQGEYPSTADILIAFLMTVVSGSLEATIVGLSQWWAMRAFFPRITRFAWWRATWIGALVGYVLGYLPSTLMAMGQAQGQVATAEPPQWLVLLLAAALGAVTGAVLSFAQWLVLKRGVSHAGWWIPANMLAWAAGMPVIFQAMDWAFRMPQLWQSLLVIAGMLFVAGAVVGAIHGRFLVRMLPTQ